MIQCLLLAAAAWFVADLFTALFHLALDNVPRRWWGVPVVGPMAREFQGHHADPYCFLGLGFWYSSRETLLAGVVPLLCLLAWPGAWPFLVPLGLGMAFSQQIHKYAHMGAATPRWARLLQRLRLFLPPEAHGHHHHVSYHRHYGILNGWSNGPLDAVLAALGH